MGASSEQLEKLLNGILSKKFPNVKEVIVKEEDLDQHTYYIHVWVVMKDENMFITPNEPNVNEFAQIQTTIRDLSRYVLLHVNQITFARQS
jgi:hypothetical protein